MSERRTLLATLLFTDIVRSSELADRLGDRRWREVLARHHAIVRRELKRFNGRELDTAGDGFFAAFTKPAEAVRCACAIVERVRELGIEVRAGLHVGEAEVFGTKLSGVTVHIAARTMGAAGAGEVLVTGVLRDLVPGSGFGMEDLGERELKGIPGRWHLYRIASVDGQPLPGPTSAEEAEKRVEAIEPPPFTRRARVPLLAGGVAIVIVTVLVVVLATRGGTPAAVPTTHAPPSPTPPPKGQLLVVDPSTRAAVGSVPLAFRPQAIAFAEGSVWVVDEDGGRVLRIDPATRAVVATLTVGKDPVAIAVGANALWVANHFGQSISRIDPGSNTVTQTIDLDFQPVNIAAGDDGVWAAATGILVPNASNPTASLATIDPTTGRVVKTIQLKTATDCAPYLGAQSGNGWAATGFGELYRLDPSSGEPARAISVHKVFSGILVDEADGVIWLSRDGSPGEIIPYDLTTGRIGSSTPVGTTLDNQGPGCTDMWIASSGTYLWVTNADDGSLTVIASVSHQGVTTLKVPGTPTGLAYGVDRLWVTLATA
jgi:YVTN family beta-propeller protein